MKLLIAAVLVLAPATVHAKTLELVCYGVSQYAQDTSGKVTSRDFWGEKTERKVTLEGTGQSRGAVQLRIHDNSWAEIKIPRELVPLLSSGGDDWYTLDSLSMTETEIRGQFELNFRSNPKVTVDRRSGFMELTGAGGGFRGECDKAPDASTPKRF